MRGELVAIDLETTGLDPQADRILEFGGVRIVDGEIVEEYNTLINPGCSIPPYITHLTGITDEDVADAPILRDVHRKIHQFIKDVPVIAHNVSFDLSFLRANGLAPNNLPVDTYELASILLPSAVRYNLNSLTMDAGIQLDYAHRALHDARATAKLYWYLWEKALTLPTAILNEIAETALHLKIPAARFFTSAIEEQTARNIATQTKTPHNTFFSLYNESTSTLQPTPTPQTIAQDEIVDLLGEHSPLAKTMPDYEHRPQQIDMAKAVASAFNRGEHLLVEAGTGTGKSIAYLMPAALWALQNGQRVVISTGTINLQEQLLNNDIPLVKAALGHDELRAAVMKGRSNYLCPRRLETVRRRKPTNIEEWRLLAKILVWLLEDQSGDKNGISLRGLAEHSVWQRLSAEDEGCTMEQCAKMGGICPFFKARKAAEAAHILIVNHALLVSDAASDNHVLPEYDYVIIDEAHDFEAAVTSGMSYRIDEAALRRRIADLGDLSNGLLGAVAKAGQQYLPDRKAQKLIAYMQDMVAASQSMRVVVQKLYQAVYHFLVEEEVARSAEYTITHRLTPQNRQKTAFQQIQRIWVKLEEYLSTLHDALGQLINAIQRMEEATEQQRDNLLNSIAATMRYFEMVYEELHQFFIEPDSNMVYWIAFNSDPKQASLQSAPLHIGPLVENYLWEKKRSVVLTSATLQTANSFEYIQQRLYAEHIQTIDVGSPFDYRQSTLVYLPSDIPEPNDRQGKYQKMLERAIIELATALGGRIMVLFTSYSHLRQTAQAVGPRLALGDIEIFTQSDGTSREALLDGFQETERAVLLGTRSFWQGVDIPGDSLSGLIMARLPFAVPSDPIFAARSETYTNSFSTFAVPDAILRFRQGFGRLIRRKTDKGVFVIFDKRVLTKNYGNQFLESLPDCEIRQGPLSALPEAAAQWLQLGENVRSE